MWHSFCPEEVGGGAFLSPTSHTRKTRALGVGLAEKVASRGKQEAQSCGSKCTLPLTCYTQAKSSRSARAGTGGELSGW